MYWPKVSTRKELEMKIIKETIETRSIRKSADSVKKKRRVDDPTDPNYDPDAPEEVEQKNVGAYEKPWRLKMKKVTPVDEIKAKEATIILKDEDLSNAKVKAKKRT
jgi:hypothetical protein